MSPRVDRKDQFELDQRVFLLETDLDNLDTSFEKLADSMVVLVERIDKRFGALQKQLIGFLLVLMSSVLLKIWIG